MLKIDYDNCIELERLELTDLINRDVMQKFQDNFSACTECACTVIDRKGKNITSNSHFCKYCEYYVRSSRAGEAKCSKSHQFFATQAVRLGRIYIGKCHAGVTEFAVPLKVSGEYIGAVIGGQFTTEKLREAEVRELANELDGDFDRMLSAKKELRRVDKKYIEALTGILNMTFTSMINESFAQAQFGHLLTKIADGIEEVAESVSSVNKNMGLITEQQKSLNKSVANVEKASDDIREVLSSISKLAEQTTILGFNAQIESARAGSFGKSFAVVAAEITELADSSKKTADSISDLTIQIKENVGNTVANSDKTFEIAVDQRDTVSDTIDRLDELKELSELLKKSVVKK